MHDAGVIANRLNQSVKEYNRMHIWTIPRALWSGITVEDLLSPNNKTNDHYIHISDFTKKVVDDHYKLLLAI